MATNACPLAYPIPAEGVQRMSGSHLRVRTPTASGEVTAAINVDNAKQPDFCLTNAYTYKTLAYTANQGATGPGSQSVSVVDTYSNGVFGPKPSMPVDPAVIPMGMAYGIGAHPAPARRLYLVDYASGNLRYYDAANFTQLGELILQDPTKPMSQPAAYDIAFSRGGHYAFVTHITDGYWNLQPPVPQGPNPTPGGVSVLDIACDGTPSLCDVDPDDQGTFGAPDSVTRINIDPMMQDIRFYPLSIQAVMITKDKATYPYLNGEKYPGEYLFVSGVGFADSIEVCEPGGMCYIEFAPRNLMVAVIDNNEGRCVDLNGDHQCESFAPNSDYWGNLKRAYKVMGDGVDGVELGATSHALGFAYSAGPGGKPYVYMVNEQPETPGDSRGRVYMFQYDQAVSDWSPVLDESTPDPNDLLTIIAGPTPTDVKVQKVFYQGQDRYLAYITNAGVDTVTVVDTANNQPISLDRPLKPPGYPTICPTSFDTRSKGETGYSSNYADSTVSVLNLPGNIYQGMIDVGEAPIRIVVQPVPGYAAFFESVRNELAFADPADFTTPSKQSNLISDWERVHDLQETSADPRAVIANINNFQRNMESWVVNAALKKTLNEGINLYRTAYIHDHPGL